MDLTTSERSIFQERGVLSLKEFISRKYCAAVKRSVLAELDRLNLRSNGKLAAPKIRYLPIFQQTGRLGQMIQVGSELETLFPQNLIECMNSLANAKLKPSHPCAQLLLSFPHKEEWSLNRLNWHLDLSVPKQDEVTGVQAFVLIDDVQPRGGATLALAGSHRLHYLGGDRNENAHAVLREHPVFGGLYGESSHQTEVFFQPQQINGIDVYIVEMAGRAGDVFLMDMRILHSPSVNATKNIRMMATNRFLR